MPSGTTPSKFGIPDNVKVVNDTRLPIALGNAPLSAESCNSSNRKSVREHKLGGIVPVSALEYAASCSRFGKLPREEGIVPENWFSPNRTFTNADKLPKKVAPSTTVGFP